MKKLLAILTALCLLLTFPCFAEEEENQVDVNFESYFEAGGVLYVKWTEESDELGGLGLIGNVGQTIGEMLANNGILSIEPKLEGDVFEGWMIVQEAITIDEYGWEESTYSLMHNLCYTTDELLALPVPEQNVTFMAKWASIPAEEYFAPCESEMIFVPSITMLSGEGTMVFSSEEEQYEASFSVATVEPGQTFGEVLDLNRLVSLTAEGKVFAGWMVYEYDVETMETTEEAVKEDDVLSFELFEGYHMVLRDYTICAEMISTDALAELACEGLDHVVVAVFMTAEEYMTYVQEQSAAIKASLENDPLTQLDMNEKSMELAALWDAALAAVLAEAEKALPAEECSKLTADQATWLESKDQAVEAAGHEFVGGSMYALVVNSEAAALTEARVYEVYELLK